MTHQRRKLSDIVAGADAVGKLRSAWESTAAADDLGPLPAGEYLCRILAGELATSKGGTPGYKLTLEVAEGDHAGRRAWHDIWLTPAAMPMAKRDLGKIGVAQLEQLERPLPVGILVRVRLALRTADDGTPFNRVVHLEAAGIEPPDPFAPAGDGPHERGGDDR